MDVAWEAAIACNLHARDFFHLRPSRDSKILHQGRGPTRLADRFCRPRTAVPPLPPIADCRQRCPCRRPAPLLSVERRGDWTSHRRGRAASPAGLFRCILPSPGRAADEAGLLPLPVCFWPSAARRNPCGSGANRSSGIN